MKFWNIMLKLLAEQEIKWYFNFIIISQIMQQCLKRFIQKPARPKWNNDEKAFLRQLIQRLKPQSSQDWRDVCIKMHEWGSRKTKRQYKNLAASFQFNSQRLQIKLSEQKIDQILQNFQLGKSLKELVVTYADIGINSRQLRRILLRKFKYIQCAIRRIVGISKIRPLSLKDCDYFGFIRSKSVKVPSLPQVVECCRKYRLFKKGKTTEQKKELKEVEDILVDYNSNLKKYMNQFEQYKNKELQINKRVHKDRSRRRNYKSISLIVPVTHLSSIAEALYLNKSVRSKYQNHFLNERRQSDLSNLPTMANIDSPENGMEMKDDIIDDFINLEK